MTANIRAWGNSQGIYIPKKLLAELGLNVNDRVSLSIEGDRLVIRKDESVSEKADFFDSGEEIIEKSR